MIEFVCFRSRNSRTICLNNNLNNKRDERKKRSFFLSWFTSLIFTTYQTVSVYRDQSLFPALNLWIQLRRFPRRPKKKKYQKCGNHLHKTHAPNFWADKSCRLSPDTVKLTPMHTPTFDTEFWSKRRVLHVHNYGLFDNSLTPKAREIKEMSKTAVVTTAKITRDCSHESQV